MYSLGVRGCFYEGEESGQWERTDRMEYSSQHPDCLCRCQSKIITCAAEQQKLKDWIFWGIYLLQYIFSPFWLYRPFVGKLKEWCINMDSVNWQARKQCGCPSWALHHVLYFYNPSVFSQGMTVLLWTLAQRKQDSGIESLTGKVTSEGQGDVWLSDRSY